MSIFQHKQILVDPVDLHGVLCIRFGGQDKSFISTYLTRLDQALILWGVVTAAIFLIAQFYPLDWSLQSIVWSVLSGGAILASGRLTWFWVSTRNQRWILYFWSFLVVVGLCLTDYGIVLGWGIVLGNLCSMWLAISALGYLITGIGIRAWALILMSFVHLCAIPSLMLFPAWQFFLTGVVMSSSLFCLAAFQWEHQ